MTATTTVAWEDATKPEPPIFVEDLPKGTWFERADVEESNTYVVSEVGPTHTFCWDADRNRAMNIDNGTPTTPYTNVSITFQK